MKRQIIIDIEPDDDGVRCSRCTQLAERRDPIDGYPECRCRLFDVELDEDFRYFRCLAAESRLTVLIACGDELEDNLPGEETSGNGERRAAWDHVVKEVRG